MSFISPEFCYLALIFYFLYWVLKPYPVSQKIYLTLASYCFYASWSVKFTLILFLYSIFIWFGGQWISGAKGLHQLRILKITITLIGSLSLLLFTKYYEFFREILNEGLVNLGISPTLPFIDLLVPAGVSFFTFQAITYLVWLGDPKEDDLKTQHNLLDVVLFLVFWPTLFAGPIFRAKDFMHQLYGKQVGGAIQIEKAIYFILLGLFQKIVLANWLSNTFVDQAFTYPENQNTVSSLSAIWAYTLEIFFDFSGYSLLVTGLAFLLGYQVPLNFQQPYLAKNIQDFWRRWHISLSSFIKDYIYIPLGGNRLGFARAQFNLMVAMILSGLWHGANVTFLIWGVLHALGVVLVNINARFIKITLHFWLSRLITMIFIALAWVFFRADNLDHALELLRQITHFDGAMTLDTALLILLSIIFLYMSQKTLLLENFFISIIRKYWGWRVFTAISGIIFTMIYAGPSGVPAFIYYRF
jgi:alginate O-acetyltransferase complex protein AlgI